MNKLDKIEHALGQMEAKVARLKEAAKGRQARVRTKLTRLRKFATSDEASTPQKLRVRLALQSLEDQLRSNEPMPLAEIEREVDRIYGDQSLNETYYFSRRNLKVAAFLRQGEEMEVPWSDMSYDQVAMIMDDIYGNQSDNATYYFSRAKKACEMLEASMSGKSSMSLEEVMRQMDELYGDQSKNDTFYLSRRYDDQAVVDATEEIPGYFAEDNFEDHNVVDPEYRVDLNVDTYGYYGDETIEMPHVVEDNPRAVDAAGLPSVGSQKEKTAGALNPIAKIIYEQMGGRRLSAMLGATLYNLDKGLGIKWPNRQRSKGNYVEVLLNGRDLYDMTFYNVSTRGKKKVKEFRDLFAESLVEVFENQTGWALRMSSVKLADTMQDSRDRKVVHAFVNQQPSEGKLLDTDGVTLHMRGVEASVLAEWTRGKIEVSASAHDDLEHVLREAAHKSNS